MPLEDGRGWAYSQALLRVIDAYRRAHPWVFAALGSAATAADDGGPGRLSLAAMLPGLEPGERREKVRVGAGWTGRG